MVDKPVAIRRERVGRRIGSLDERDTYQVGARCESVLVDRHPEVDFWKGQSRARNGGALKDPLVPIAEWYGVTGVNGSVKIG